MPKKVSTEQRQEVLRMLASGHDRDTIASTVGITPGQVSAIAAHVKMGTYSLPELDVIEESREPSVPSTRETTPNLLALLRAHAQKHQRTTKGHNPLMPPVWLGTDAETGKRAN